MAPETPGLCPLCSKAVGEKGVLVREQLGGATAGEKPRIQDQRGSERRVGGESRGRPGGSGQRIRTLTLGNGYFKQQSDNRLFLL